MKQFLLSITLFSLAACGGGGGGGGSVESSNTGSTGTSFSGTAMDGYLYRATVFLDLNDNGTYDRGEPTATTSETGTFTLSATQEQINTYKVVVVAVAGTTIDQDSPNTTVTSGYTMMSPAGNYQVVSPLTTQVVAKMSTGLSLANAKTAVQDDLGLTSIDVMKNYVAAKATDTNYSKAHNVATSLAEVLKTIEADSTKDTKLADKLANIRTKVTSQIVPKIEQIKAASSTALAIQITNTTRAPVFANQVTISANVNANAYPTVYAAVASTPVIDDTCLVAADSISYPAAYQGAFSLPPVKGNFASANIGLGVGIKDNWGDGYISNPNINKNCATDNRTAFVATLKRLKSLGSSYVYIAQYGCLRDAVNPTSFLGQISISDADLVWMGQQAQAQGIKARLLMQVCSNDQKGKILNNLTLDNQWYSTFFDTYSAFMVDQARIAQTAGFDAISLDWGDWNPISWVPTSSMRSDRLQQMSANIRLVFNGRQFLMSTWSTSDAPPSLVNSVDMLVAFVGTKLTEAQSSSLSVSQLLPGFTNSINSRQFLGSGKPLIWILQIQSHKDFFVNGWVEDAGCWSTPCATSLTTDFSVQAIGIEAALEAINQQTFFRTESVFINSYWLADTMTPHDSFPNTSQSIRNKPAESIVYQWWKK